MPIEFRLHYEGTKQSPSWGIAFRHKKDIKQLITIQGLPSIEIEFPNGSIYTYKIRPGFWNKCKEFVDSSVINQQGQKLKTIKPITALATQLGYSVTNNNQCQIEGVAVVQNQRLKLTIFQ